MNVRRLAFHKCSCFELADRGRRLPGRRSVAVLLWVSQLWEQGGGEDVTPMAGTMTQSPKGEGMAAQPMPNLNRIPALHNPVGTEARCSC